MVDKTEIKKNQNWPRAFQHAVEGCCYSLTTQRNFIIHLFISLLVVVLSIWLEISLDRFALLFFAIVFGLTVEMANTAFEKTVDLVTENYNPKAKVAKDVSAGMVLVASIGLAIVGVLIIFPPLLDKLAGS